MAVWDYQSYSQQSVATNKSAFEASSGRCLATRGGQSLDSFLFDSCTQHCTALQHFATAVSKLKQQHSTTRRLPVVKKTAASDFKADFNRLTPTAAPDVGTGH